MKNSMFIGLLFIATTAFAHASCYDKIQLIKQTMGTDSGGSSEGVVDRLKTYNNLFKRTVEISQDLVSRSYGRPIAVSGLHELNKTLVSIQNGYVISSANLALLGWTIQQLEDECVDK